MLELQYLGDVQAQNKQKIHMTICLHCRVFDPPGDRTLLCFPPLHCSVPGQPWRPPAAAWRLCAAVLSCLPALSGPHLAGPIDGPAQGTLGGEEKRGEGARDRESEGERGRRRECREEGKRGGRVE